MKTELSKFLSFDGQISISSDFARPDRYRVFDQTWAKGPYIAQGGGYSYAAASFGQGVTTVSMRSFSRILFLDENNKTVTVEAGITLGELLGATSRRGLALGVQPGYPDITIGGCIAADVNGKNFGVAGSFHSCVISLVLYHPAHGLITLSEEENKELFDLTCGGYGSTGIIVSATLRLEQIKKGEKTLLHRSSLNSLTEGLEQLRSSAVSSSNFAYTFHVASPTKGLFGRGFLYTGEPAEGNGKFTSPPSYRPITARARSISPISLWASPLRNAALKFYLHQEEKKTSTNNISLFASTFPFAANPYYFLAYGKRGLAEAQVIITDEKAGAFLELLEALLFNHNAPGVMISLKKSSGLQTGFRFAGPGICVTLDMAQTSSTSIFLTAFDELCLEHKAIPNLIKDSRLSQEVVSASYPEYELTIDRINKLDPNRVFMSELLMRAGL